MKFTKFLALFCAVAAFVGCEPTTQEQKPNTTGSITLTADKTTLELGESVTFTATQKDEATGEIIDITPYVSLMDSDVNDIPNPFTPEASGHYTIFCTYGAESSNNVDITVMAQMPIVPADPEPANLKFNHRVVLIDHTGVRCPNCPMMTDNLIALSKTEWHQHYNEVTCHAGSYANGDPANSQAATALDRFNANYIEGYPTTLVNFYGQGALLNWQSTYFVNTGAPTILGSIVKKNGADVGISMAVAGDATTLYCAAQVKANVAQEYKVVAWLLESNIYSPNQAGAKNDTHKLYNYALRNISGKYDSTNVSGESVGTIESGETIDCAFELPIVSTKWNYENMGVLVIVSAKDTNGRWQVANSAYCKIGENKTFEYVK